MKKALLVTDIFPPDIGGPATFIDSLALSLARQGHEVTVICHSDRPTEESDGARPFTVRRTCRSDAAVWDKTGVALLQEMTEHDTILVNGLEHLSCLAAKRTGRKYIMKIVGDYVWEAARNTWRTSLSIDDFQSAVHTDPWFQERINQRTEYLKEAKLIIVPSMYLKRMVSGWGVEESKIVVIPNGINLREYTRFMPQSRPCGPLKLAFCGRLVSWKGIDTLFHAVQPLEEVTVEIFGDGPERPYLEKLSESLGLMEKVRFHGILHGANLRQALADCHVLVLGSQYEGLSHTLIEAGGLGLARVASQCGGNPEVIEDGVNGILYPYGSVEDLRDAIVRLRDEEEYRMAIALKGKESSYLFDFNRTVNETVRLLTVSPIIGCRDTRQQKTSPLKVTHLMELGEYPGLAPFSGAENHLFVLMKGLVRSSVIVEFMPVIRSDGPSLHAKFKELEKDGITVVPVPYEGTTELERERNCVARLRALFSARTDHIIHTHLETADYVGKVAASLANCRQTMSSVHNNEPFYAEPEWRRRLQILDNFTVRYITISNAVRDHLIQVVGLPPEKLINVYYGLKLETSAQRTKAEIRRAANIPADKFVIGFTGRLQPQKNVDQLICAMERLPDVHCVIVGAGHLGADLQNLVLQKNLTNVQFLGYQPNGQELISCFDIFCLPSLWEGLGLVLLEAMLQKVPIVASTAGAIPEVLQYGKSGLLFDPRSVDDLVAKLQLATTNHALMQQYAEQAYSFATSFFCEDRMIAQTIALYEEIIGEAGQTVTTLPAQENPETPLVSVIVPTHNRPAMLKCCIRSILDQTLQDFEIVVVNDAGEDVLSVVASFASPKIAYVTHDTNKGLAAARNTGIRTARGKYIAYLDDDDLFYPDHLETLVTALQENGVKVAYTNAFRAHQHLQGDRYVTYYKDVPYSFDFDYERILYENYIPVLCFMHEKACLDICGMFDESLRRLEDWELWLRMSRQFSMLHIGSLTCEFSYRPDGSSMVSGSLVKFLDSTRSLFNKHPVSSESPILAKRQQQIFTLRYDAEKQLVDAISSVGILALEDFLSSSVYTSLAAEGVPQEMIVSAFYHGQARLDRTGSGTEEFLVKALATDPENYSARCTLCGFLIKQNRLDEVKPHLQHLKNVHPDCAIINEIAKSLREQRPELETAHLSRRKINLAVYSFDLPEQACSQLRFLGARGQLPEDVDILWGTYFDPQKGNFTIFQEFAAQADIIVFARFFPRKETSSFIESVFALGKPVVYDLDDLLTELPDENPFKRNGDEARPLIENVMKRVDLITISNTQLQQELHVHNRKIVVLGNLLDQTLWGQALPPRSSTSDIVIGYAGGFTHGEDLRILDEVLPAIASNFGSRVRFRFIGCISDRLRSLPNCEFIEAEPNYGSYAMKLRHAGFDIALAPLCDNRFNRCKSNIKWLEYAACGCAGIFSDLPPYECVDHGRTGLLVRNTPEQWYEAISFLIENPSTRTAIGSNARTEVLSHHTLANNLHWLDAYRSLVHTQQPTPLKTVNTAPVSVVIPVYNQLALTMQCLQTLKENTPENSLEVIVVDNASSDGTNEYLKNAPLNIKVITNTSNLGFARACNQGASAASGEYILFLNNDIEVLPNWLDPLLSRIASDQSIAAVGSKLLFPDGTIQHAGVMIIEDHKNNELLAPFHRHYKQPSETRKANLSKPCQALTAACLLVRREAFDEVGGFCEEYWNGYEDVDLCFKLGQKGWKLIYEPASVLIHHESKSGKERFIRQTENIALLHKKWLGKIKPDVFVDEQDRWYSLTDEIHGTPLSTIIIPLYNGLAFTRQCLDALLADPFASRQEIIVVDNGSRDGTPAYLQTLDGQIRLVTNEDNIGFSKACNQGAEAATGDYLVFLNNDTIPKPGWLEALIRGAQADSAAVVGAKLLYPNGTVQHAGVAFGEGMGPYHIFNGFRNDDPAVNRKRVMQAVTAACMLVERELFLRLGGFDEEYLNGFEDIDFCLRAKQHGARVLYAPESELIHFESASPGRKQNDEANLARFRQRWEHNLHFDDEEIYRSEGISLVREANGQVFIERHGTP